MDFKNIGGIDLHIHSTASDGTYDPAELVRLAIRQGLQAIAITDHDTLEGSKKACAAGIPSNFHFLSGVEISAKPPGNCGIGGSLHILGYGIDLQNRDLEKAMTDLQTARNQRAPKIIQKLNSLGVPIQLSQVQAETGKGSVGRPHIAAALVKMGAATDINDAFNNYLAKGSPAYVDKYRLNCKVTLELIRAAGGVPVLAHPYLITSGDGIEINVLIEKLWRMGLMGIEVYYPSHTPEFITQMESIAQRYNLLMTGGTDFHGQLSPGIHMGSGAGDFYVPFQLYEKLRQAIEKQHRLACCSSA
ncbi:MAG: PHP domain-containing protein [Desulfobacteraceae bacterium]|nr:PHP domain-containing protein [Desulfobacteraceae bacterium]